MYNQYARGRQGDEQLLYTEIGHLTRCGTGALKLTLGFLQYRLEDDLLLRRNITARISGAQTSQTRENRTESGGHNLQIARDKSYVIDVVIAKDNLSSVTFLFLGINERIARHMHSSVLHMLGIMRVLLPIVSVVIC